MTSVPMAIRIPMKARRIHWMRVKTGCFSGRGLRLGLEEQARQAPPPFEEAIARALPPGLQSFCLRLLDPEAKPPLSGEIHARLGEWIDAEPEERRSIPRMKRSDPAPAPEKPAPARVAKAERTWLHGFLSTGVPPLAGVGLAAVVLLSFGSQTPKPERHLTRPALDPRYSRSPHELLRHRHRRHPRQQRPGSVDR